MNERKLKNLPASIRQKLLNKAKADNRPFNELLQYYASERFLYDSASLNIPIDLC